MLVWHREIDEDRARQDFGPPAFLLDCCLFSRLWQIRQQSKLLDYQHHFFDVQILLFLVIFDRLEYLHPPLLWLVFLELGRAMWPIEEVLIGLSGDEPHVF